VEPKEPQLNTDSASARRSADSIGFDFAKPRRVTLDELSPDPATGRYTATKPGNVKEVDTKAEIAEIRADKAKDAEKSAAAKQFIQDNATQIAAMQAPPKPKKKISFYMAKKIAAQRAAQK
jgi:hypothetical protein